MTTLPLPLGWCQRWTDRKHSWRHRDQGGFDRRRYDWSVLEETTARRFVERHHYSGSFPAARLSMGMHDRSGRLVGVAVLAVPVRAEVLTGPFPDLAPYRESVELGRFVLLDDVPANGETWFLARVFEHLRAATEVRGVVAFSDPIPRHTAAGRVVMPGHWGTIYQAKGAAYLGRGRARWLTLLPDGTVLNDRARAKLQGGERGWRYVLDRLVALGATPPSGVGPPGGGWLDVALLELGARRVRHGGNLRYGFALHRAVRVGMTPGAVSEARRGVTAPARTGTFYLGCPEPAWMSRTRAPLFVSHVRLRRRKSLPRAAGRWALDSGGFSESPGTAAGRSPRPRTRPRCAATATRSAGSTSPRRRTGCAGLLARTGLTQDEHQRRTVENLLELRALAPDLPWAPVVQGWTCCVELYAAAVVDLTAEPRVGIGSVCRRTSPVSVAFIVASLHGAGLRNLHGFGIKTSALALCAEQLASADSMAWSFAARAGSERCPDGRRDCRNCLHFATEWGADAAAAAGRSARTGSATAADEPAAIDQRDRQHDVRAAAQADRAESIRPDGQGERNGDVQGARRGDVRDGLPGRRAR